MSPEAEAAESALAPREEDPLLKSAAHSGELTVARARLWIIVPLLFIQLLPGWDWPMRRVGVTMSLVGLAWSLGLLWLVRRSYRPALGFLSSAGDVTLVTATLLGYVLGGLPGLVPGSRVAFEVYFLALVATTFRYDWRAPALAGVVAVAQFAGVATFAASRWDASLAGPFPWNVVVARLILLVAMTFVAMAIVDKARRLREASIHDRLTGLLNRAAFEDRLREEASRSLRSGRSFAVAVLDVDLFKRINDTHGHAAGDAVLQQVAGALRRGIRTADIVARWGGEEFAFLLPESRTEGAVLHMERLRAAIAMDDLVAGSTQQMVRLTVSVGVATFPDDGRDPGEALARADARLYEAKRLGRNRVVGPRPLGPAEPVRTAEALPLVLEKP